MLIEHSLRIAGCPARITEAAGIPPVAFVPATASISSASQSIEVVVEADVLLDRRPLRLHSLDQRREGAIIKEDAVLRVIDDILELAVEQPRLSVWRTPPMPTTPNQATKWRSWFIAMVATRSPGFTSKPFERLRQTPGIMCDALPVRAVG